jgi:hypothetical protein
MNNFIELWLKDGRYTLNRERPNLIVELESSVPHEDWKAHQPYLPPGIYGVSEIFTNLYGNFLRIKHEDMTWDIKPKYAKRLAI